MYIYSYVHTYIFCSKKKRIKKIKLPMENPNSTLLPHILEVLSLKKDFSDSIDNVCTVIEAFLEKEKQLGQYGNVRSAVERSIRIGQNLGILSFSKGIVRVPFNFYSKRFSNRSANTEVLWMAPPQPMIGTGNPLPQYGSSAPIPVESAKPVARAPPKRQLQTKPKIRKTVPKSKVYARSAKTSVAPKARSRSTLKQRSGPLSKKRSRPVTKGRPRAAAKRLSRPMKRSRSGARAPIRRKQSGTTKRGNRRNTRGRPRRR